MKRAFTSLILALLFLSTTSTALAIKKTTYTSTTGLVSVDVYLDKIVFSERDYAHERIPAAVFSIEYKWLGTGGMADIYTMLPSRAKTYALKPTYDATTSDVDYNFVLYEDGKATLSYSVRAYGLTNYSDKLTSYELGLTSDENEIMDHMDGTYDDLRRFNEDKLVSLMAKQIVGMQGSRKPIYLSNLPAYALNLALEGSYNTLAELLHDEIVVDNHVFSDLSDCKKSYLVGLLYAYDFGEIRISYNMEELNALIKEYLENIQTYKRD